MSTTCNRCRNFSNMERSHTKTKLLNNIYMQESFLRLCFKQWVSQCIHEPLQRKD